MVSLEKSHYPDSYFRGKMNDMKGCWFSYDRYNMKVNIPILTEINLKSHQLLFCLSIFPCGCEDCFFAFNMQTCLALEVFATLQVKNNHKD